MKKSPVLLQPWHKRLLYLAIGLLWASGALWLYLNYFCRQQGQYGSQAHPAQPILLEIHGAVAMGFLILFGMLLTQHVPVGWKQGLHRPSGVSLIVISGLLILTSWGLYYVSNNHLRAGIAIAHWVIGLAFPLFIAAHIFYRKTARRNL